MFSKNETVAVCYGGAPCRAVEGKVVKTGPIRKSKPPAWIWVRFKPWANEEAGFVEFKLKPFKGFYYHNYKQIQTVYYAGWLTGKGELGLMKWLGQPGDWYNVYQTRDIIRQGLGIEPYDREPE